MIEAIREEIEARRVDGLSQDEAVEDLALAAGVAAADLAAVLGGEERPDTEQRIGELLDGDAAPARWAVPVDEHRSEWLAPQVRRGDAVLAGESESEFIASTSREARDGDIIDQGSWRLENYRANRVILDNHDPRHVVGRAARLGVVEDSLRVAVGWDDSDVNERGRLVAHQHREGYRSAVSVRWLTGRAVERHTLDEDHPYYAPGKMVDGFFGPYLRVGRVHYEPELLEISSVSIPSDPRALQLRGMPRDQQLRHLRGDEVLRQIPDGGIASELRQALADPSLWADEAVRAHVRSALLHLCRSDREIRTVLRAVGLTTRTRPPAPECEPGLADFLFS